MARSKSTPFKLRSGNTTAFKQMGGSPMQKNPSMDTEGAVYKKTSPLMDHNIAHWRYTKTRSDFKRGRKGDKAWKAYNATMNNDARKRTVSDLRHAADTGNENVLSKLQVKQNRRWQERFGYDKWTPHVGPSGQVYMMKNDTEGNPVDLTAVGKASGRHSGLNRTEKDYLQNFLEHGDNWQQVANEKRGITPQEEVVDKTIEPVEKDTKVEQEGVISLEPTAQVEKIDPSYKPELPTQQEQDITATDTPTEPSEGDEGGYGDEGGGGDVDVETPSRVNVPQSQMTKEELDVEAYGEGGKPQSQMTQEELDVVAYGRGGKPQSIEDEDIDEEIVSEDEDDDNV